MARQFSQRPGQGRTRAPLRNRTVDLLLTIYPRADAVANWDDAGQVRGGALCCRPTYLVIAWHPAVMSPPQLVTLRKRRRMPAVRVLAQHLGAPPQRRTADQPAWQHGPAGLAADSPDAVSGLAYLAAGPSGRAPARRPSPVGTCELGVAGYRRRAGGCASGAGLRCWLAGLGRAAR